MAAFPAAYPDFLSDPLHAPDGISARMHFFEEKNFACFKGI
jgi:hypothetical protein